MKENVEIKIEFILNKNSLIHATASKITISKCKLVFKRKKKRRRKRNKEKKRKRKGRKEKSGGTENVL